MFGRDKATDTLTDTETDIDRQTDALTDTETDRQAGALRPTDTEPIIMETDRRTYTDTALYINMIFHYLKRITRTSLENVPSGLGMIGRVGHTMSSHCHGDAPQQTDHF